MPNTRPTPAARRRMSGRQRIGGLIWAVLRLLFWLPLWLLALIMLVLGLVLAPFGTGFLLSQAEKHDLVSVEQHSGGLLDDFHLQGLAVDVPGVEARIGEFELAWADDCLLSGKLCVDKLTLADADIRLSPSGEPKETSPEPEDADASGGNITLPFPVALRELRLDNVSLQLGDGTRLSWAHFSTAVNAAESRVTVEPTQLDQPRLYLPPSPGVRLTQNLETPLFAEGIDAAIALHAPEPEEPDTPAEDPVPLDEQLAAREPVELPTIRLPLNVKLESLAVNDFVLSGAASYTVNKLRLGLEGKADRVTLTQFNLVTPDASARLDADTTLSQAWPLSANLKVVLFLPELMPELSGEELTLALSGAADDLHAELNASGAVDARLTASANLLAPTLPFKLRLQSDALQWPLPPGDAVALAESTAVNADAATRVASPEERQSAAEPATAAAPAETAAYRLRSLDLEAGGDLEGYEARLDFQAQGPTLPTTRVSLTGSGDITHFAWQPLSVSSGDGQLSSQGRVQWQAPFQAGATLTLDDIDPGRFVESLEGRLNGNAEFNLRQLDDQWAVQVPGVELSGELQGYPLSLDAALDADSNLNLDINRLAFAQGNNRLTASGHVSEDAIDLDADIDLRELGSIAPQLSGNLTGDIQARGRFQAPRLQADLNGDGLDVAGNTLSKLRLDADVSGIDDPALDVGLELSGVEAGGQSLDSVTLDLDGKLSQHRLTLEADGGADNDTLTRASLALDGGLHQDQERYDATLSPLEVDSGAGDIRLASPLDIRYRLDAGELALTPFCLRREQGGALCADQAVKASAQQGEAALALREVPMEAIEPFLPEGWKLEGDTTADLAASWSEGGDSWQAEGDVNSDLNVTALNNFGQPVALPPISLEAKIGADPRRADADVTLALDDAGDATLNVAVDDPLDTGTLDGNLAINDIALAPYKPLVVGMSDLAGRLEGNVNLAGTTQKPDLNGNIALDDLNLAGPDIPVTVPDGQVEVSFNGERGRIDGFVEAERGRLAISGDAAWPADADWRADVDLDAESPLLVTLPAFGRLEAAPDIRVRANPERLKVRGKVDVPWARLEVGDIPKSATSPSADEVIITEQDDREAERRERQQAAADTPSAADELESGGMAMDVRISINLGRDMQLDAYGLTSGLGGSLDVRQNSGGLQLFGDVNLEDGRFQAFGQDLVIRRGKIYFSGPPGLPALDFEAIRNPEVTEDDVIAGVRVTGIAAEPDIAIFSEPAMDETRSLSYLLRGRAPDASGDGVDSALTTALIGMSLGRAGGAVGSVGEAFGIDNLTLDTAGSGDDSQVAVSGQINDKLKVSYGVGIFSPIAELTLRYTLLRDLYLQAVSGANQAVDLIYQFSRDGNPAILDPGD